MSCCVGDGEQEESERGLAKDIISEKNQASEKDLLCEKENVW